MFFRPHSWGAVGLDVYLEANGPPAQTSRVCGLHGYPTTLPRPPPGGCPAPGPAEGWPVSPKDERACGSVHVEWKWSWSQSFTIYLLFCFSGSSWRPTGWKILPKTLWTPESRCCWGAAPCPAPVGSWPATPWLWWGRACRLKVGFRWEKGAHPMLFGVL